MIGAVDVGTNTVRLLLGSCRDGRVMPEQYFRRITRLGGDLTAGKLALPARERTLAALGEIARLVEENGVEIINAVGTAVLRRAVDGEDFASAVRSQTGLPLQIIDGEEEARLTALGVIAALDPRPPACLIVDIGGGSTEFVLWQETPLLHRSYPLGVVRLAEEHPEPLVQQAQIATVLADLRSELVRQGLWTTASASECELVGTAGTVTTLAALRLRMTNYDWRRVNNLVLEGGELACLLRQLEPLPVAAREALPGMEQGRGDLILPGLRIVLAILTMFGRRELTVSDFGLLEGILLDMGNCEKARRN